MRRIDLSREVRISPSGITRMLDRLEATGLVGKKACAKDARVTYAVLTPEGKRKLEEARTTHVASVRALFSERFDTDELQALASLLERLPMTTTPCD